MPHREPDTDQLLQDVSRGDTAARSQLLQRHRPRLRRLIAVRLDPRLAARVDPSDVVQDVLLEADRQLSDYVEKQPLPLYPLLRQLAWNRLIDLYRRHIRTHRRSVTREEMALPRLPDESALELIERLYARNSSPSAGAERAEARQRVQQALQQLPECDRELLVLRHLEQLSTAEIASVLGIGEGAVYTRHLRALRRLGELLKNDHPEE